MNKLFGFFKQKIVQANVENKRDIQTIVNAISGDDTGYKGELILSHLQKIKSNYTTWSILIANQASTGLYYSQLHNRDVCIRKAGLDQQFEKTFQKNQITLNQLQKTHQELIEIGRLNQSWVQAVAQNMETIKQLRTKRNLQKKRIKQQQQKGAQQQLQKQTYQKQENLLQNNASQHLNNQSISTSVNQSAYVDIKSSPIIITTITQPPQTISFSSSAKTSSQIIISADRW